MNEQLDPTVVSLAKAIKKNETGDGDTYNYPTGKDGEIGAYRYLPSTWKMWAKKHLGDENAPISKENQNKVAYSQIKEWKDAGLNPAQIASKWNSGDENAYKNPNHKGISKGGAQFDTPAYAQRVSQDYMRIKGSVAQPQAAGQEVQGQDKPKDEGLLKSIIRGVTQPVATLLARPIQAGAELLGASAEDVNKISSKVPFFGEGGRLDVPQNAGDVVKDVGRGVETVGLGLPVGTIGNAAKTGAVIGVGSGLESGEGVKGALEQGALGAGLGAVGGSASALISKASNWIPKQLMQNALRDATPETIDLALKKPFMTIGGGLERSQNVIAQHGNKIDTILKDIIKKSPERALGSKSNTITQTLLEFPDSGFTPDELAKRIKNLVPTKAKLVDKILEGKATILDKNNLRKAIDTKPGIFDRYFPEMTANKQIGKVFADKLRNEVQAWAPDTKPIFEELTKEIPLRDSLRTAAKKAGVHRGIGLTDLMALTSGGGFAGPVGAIGGVAVERGLRSPKATYTAARLGKGLVNMASKAASTTKKPLLKAAIDSNKKN